MLGPNVEQAADCKVAMSPGKFHSTWPSGPWRGTCSIDPFDTWRSADELRASSRLPSIKIGTAADSLIALTMAKLTKAQHILRAIADDIVHGRLLPGAALDETTFSAAFNVSRTPVREAIRQLAAIGLIDARARRGAVVATVSARELDEMFAVMGEVEALCARWSAIAMTARERRQLLALQAESAPLVSAGRHEAYVAFNNRFHEAIYRGAHNRFLAHLALAVRRRCAPFRRAQFETLGRLAKSHEEHAAVVDAIQRGDAETAALEMRSHIVVVRDAVDEVAGDAVRRSGRAQPGSVTTDQSAYVHPNRRLPISPNN